MQEHDAAPRLALLFEPSLTGRRARPSVRPPGRQRRRLLAFLDRRELKPAAERR